MDLHCPRQPTVTPARCLHFDLLGLPPTPEVVERFEHSDDPLAYELLVDELLASPHFGERMAMWWLDLVCYADSVGYHGGSAGERLSFSRLRHRLVQ